MKKVSKAMYGKLMMKTGGAKKYQSGGSSMYANTTEGEMPAMKKVGGSTKSYKTGGMVNANTKVSADKTPGSKGVKSGVNKKASKQTSAKGRVGGTSTAPKGAVPKAKMGGSKKSC